MRVIGLNRICNWCQVISNGRTYTCKLKEINGNLFFFFKKAYHPVSEFVSERAEELVEESGRVFSRLFKGN